MDIILALQFVMQPSFKKNMTYLRFNTCCEGHDNISIANLRILIA